MFGAYGYGAYWFIGVIGIVYALYDLFTKNRKTKFFWIVTILILPFGWLIYVLASMADNKNSLQKQDELAASVTQQVAQGPVPIQSSPQTSVAVQQIQPTTKIKMKRSTFQIIGTVLGVSVLAFGFLAVGLFILILNSLNTSSGNGK